MQPPEEGQSRANDPFQDQENEKQPASGGRVVGRHPPGAGIHPVVVNSVHPILKSVLEWSDKAVGGKVKLQRMAAPGAESYPTQ